MMVTLTVTRVTCVTLEAAFAVKHSNKVFASSTGSVVIYLAGWSPLSHRHTAPDVVYSYIPISLMTKIVKTTIQITIVTHVTPVTLSLPHADHDKEES